MKLLIASDIHGSAFWCRKLMEVIGEEQPDRIALLGDILYHGPRNALPRDYDPPSVAAMLNKMADRIVAVRGNCDSEVDQMVLDFPCMGDYALIMDEGECGFVGEGEADGPDSSCGQGRSTAGLRSESIEPVCRQLMLTHGHVFGPDNVPPHPDSSNGQVLFALVSGHTHVKTNVVRDGVLFVNPGSVSIPKDGTHSCMVYENGLFVVRELAE